MPVASTRGGAARGGSGRTRDRGEPVAGCRLPRRVAGRPAEVLDGRGIRGEPVAGRRLPRRVAGRRVEVLDRRGARGEPMAGRSCLDARRGGARRFWIDERLVASRWRDGGCLDARRGGARRFWMGEGLVASLWQDASCLDARRRGAWRFWMHERRFPGRRLSPGRWLRARQRLAGGLRPVEVLQRRLGTDRRERLRWNRRHGRGCGVGSAVRALRNRGRRAAATAGASYGRPDDPTVAAGWAPPVRAAPRGSGCSAESRPGNDSRARGGSGRTATPASQPAPARRAMRAGSPGRPPASRDAGAATRAAGCTHAGSGRGIRPRGRSGGISIGRSVAASAPGEAVGDAEPPIGFGAFELGPGAQPADGDAGNFHAPALRRDPQGQFFAGSWWPRRSRRRSQGPPAHRMPPAAARAGAARSRAAPAPRRRRGRPRRHASARTTPGARDLDVRPSPVG